MIEQMINFGLIAIYNMLVLEIIQTGILIAIFVIIYNQIRG